MTSLFTPFPFERALEILYCQSEFSYTFPTEEKYFPMFPLGPIITRIVFNLIEYSIIYYIVFEIFTFPIDSQNLISFHH